MAALPTPKEVYERLAEGLGPVLVELGMRRVPRLSWPCWVRQSPLTSDQVYLSLQVDEKATDPFSGGGFRVELEKSGSPRPAAGLNGRALFFQLLTSQEGAAVLACQNRVIQALPRPPAAQVELYPDGPVRRMYLSYFESQEGFDPVRSWMRYRTMDDLDAWVRTLEPLMGAMVSRAEEYLRRETRHLGRGSLVEAHF